MMRSRLIIVAAFLGFLLSNVGSMGNAQNQIAGSVSDSLKTTSKRDTIPDPPRMLTPPSEDRRLSEHQRLLEHWQKPETQEQLRIIQDRARRNAHLAIRDVSIRNLKPKRVQRPPVEVTNADRYYDSGKKRVGLQYRGNEISLKFKENVDEASKEVILANTEFLNKTYSETLGLWTVQISGKRDLEAITRALRQREEITYAYPVISIPNSKSRTYLTNEFTVKFLPDFDLDQIKRLNNIYDVHFIRQVKGISNVHVLELKLGSKRDILDVVTAYDRHPQVVHATPDYIHTARAEFFPQNDDKFSEQWNLYHMINKHVEAPDAWEISKGDSIVVAVIGAGLQLNHWDFDDNLVQGNDFANNPLTPPNGRVNYTFDNDFDLLDIKMAHENWIAGIIAAEENNGGMIGLAPKAKIMPIRTNDIDNQGSATQWKMENWSDAIDWAWRNGADVINLSYVIVSSVGEWNNKMSEVIDSAVVRGRNGKGCILVCPAGNDYTEIPSNYYPQNDPRFLVIGGYKWEGSHTRNWGDIMDVLAPSDFIEATDFLGNDGYTGDHTSQIAGTSFSGPQVAALAALIMDANPSLNYLQVGELIRQGAEKWRDSTGVTYEGINLTGFDETYAYGRMDAYSSVLLAANLIDDPNFESDSLGVAPPDSVWYKYSDPSYYTVVAGDGDIFNQGTRGAAAGFRSLKIDASGTAKYAAAFADYYSQGQYLTATIRFKATSTDPYYGPLVYLEIENSSGTEQTWEWGRYNGNGREWQTLTLVHQVQSGSPTPLWVTIGAWDKTVAVIDLVTVREGRGGDIPNGNFEAGLVSWSPTGSWKVNGAWTTYNNYPQPGQIGFFAGSFPQEYDTGSLTSGTFIINKPFINLRIGGQDNMTTANKVRLFVGGVEKRVAYVPYDNGFVDRTWDVKDFYGQEVYIKAEDNNNNSSYAWFCVDEFKQAYEAAVPASGGGGGGGNPFDPLTSQDVGNVGSSGSASYDGNGIYTVKGSGEDIWDYEDGFHFLYRVLNGNGTIIARVATMDNTNEWAKAGVMIRESMADDSKHAMMIVTPSSGQNQGTSFQRRTSSGGSSSAYTPDNGITPPYWMRLERSGNEFTAKISSDGVNWTQQGSSVTISMNSTVYMGLVVTAHNNSALNTSTFDNVSLTGILSKPTALSLVDLQPDLPSTFAVAQNFPNPFNPETTIVYALSAPTDVSLVVYNVLGQKVRALVSDYKSAGQYRVVWDGRDGLGELVSSGIYFYHFQAGAFKETKKMLILK